MTSGRHRHPLAFIGPGLVTGAADDDPSGIATYSQAGARFGTALLWTTLFTVPFMVAIQSISARIGRGTGRGLAANIRDAFHPRVVRAVVALLLIANTLNIAADLTAMGDAASLAVGGSRHLFTLGFALLTLVLQVTVPYHRYVAYLKWLTLTLLAYAAVAFSVHVPWHAVLVDAFWPHVALDRRAIATVVALFGTTISPYLFFWQSSQEVEEIVQHGGQAGLAAEPDSAPREGLRIDRDTTVGMLYSNAIAFFIMLSAAVTLHTGANGDAGAGIATAAQAAAALRPIAGRATFALFAAGIITTGLLAVPVLAGSAAYALSETLGWREGLERRFAEARGFYGIVTVAIAGGVALDYSGVDPVRALFGAAIVNGVVAAPLMLVIMVLAERRSLMGAFVPPRAERWLGWSAVVLMGAATVGLAVI